MLPAIAMVCIQKLLLWTTRASMSAKARQAPTTGRGMKTNGKKHTWLQLERYTLAQDLINNVLHVAAFAQYWCLNKNIGPYGTSAYTEANPIGPSGIIIEDSGDSDTEL